MARLQTSFEAVAAKLADGDLLLWTLAGHGEVHVSTDGEERLNQAFVLDDDLLVDDDVHSWLQMIRAKARVVLVVDACHSGSMATAQAVRDDRVQPAFLTAFEAAEAVVPSVWAPQRRHPGLAGSRIMAPGELVQFLSRETGWYSLTMRQPSRPRPTLDAEVILVAAVEDNLLAPGIRRPGARYPPFTEALVETWENSSSYWALHTAVTERVYDPSRPFTKPVLNCRLVRDMSILDARPFRP